MLNNNIQNNNMTLMNTNNNKPININNNDRKFLIMIGADCENIINNYVFEMEHEDRIEEHKETFGDILLEIRGVNYNKLLKKMEDNITWTIGVNGGDRYIDVGFTGDFTGDDINGEGFFFDWEIRLEIDNNFNVWSSRDLLEDLLRNYLDYFRFDSKSDFVEYCFEMNNEDYDRDLEIEYNKWWDNCEVSSDLIDSILTEFDFERTETEDFRNWVSDNV